MKMSIVVFLEIQIPIQFISDISNSWKWKKPKFYIDIDMFGY